MSADVKSVPPWKLALIEKRRKQEEEDRQRRKEEEERLTQMPSWKRDILLKKQQQKNSLVFFAKPSSNSHSDLEVSPQNHEAGSHHSVALGVSVNSENHVEQVPATNHYDVTDDGPAIAADDSGAEPVVRGGPSEEHIIPIQQNPWLRTEIQHGRYHPRHHSPSGRPSSGSESDHYNSLPRNIGSTSSCHREPGDVHNETDDGGDEEIFNNDEQDIAYGRGFVHKLLEKFKHLSTREEKPTNVTGPKRSHSTENILEESHGSGKGSPRHYSSSEVSGDGIRSTGIYSSPAKARSMENLAGSNKHSYSNLEVKVVGEPRDSSQGSLDGSFSSGSMQSPRSTSGNDAVSNHLGDEEPSSHNLSHDSVSLTFVDGEGPPSLKRYGSSENLIEDELPRANIVSATRSLFENVTGTLTINKTKRKSPSPKVETAEFKYSTSGSASAENSLPNGSVSKQEELLRGRDSYGGSSQSSGVGGESGDGVSPRQRSVQQMNGSKAGNDRNANYKSDTSGVFNTESRTGIGPTAVARSKASDQGPVNGTWSASSTSSVSQESNNIKPSSHSIMQKNNQNNNRLSSTTTSSSSSLSSSSSSHIPAKSTSEIISPDQGSNKLEYNLANNSSKKRQAPLPPSSIAGGGTPHVSVVQVQNNDEAGSAQPKKPNLFLDLGSESRAPKPAAPEEPLSYRDLYFPRSPLSPSSSSSSSTVKKVTPSGGESQKDLINTSISGTQRNGVLESKTTTTIFSSSSSVPAPAAPEPTRTKPQTLSSSSSSETSKAKPVSYSSTTKTSSSSSPVKPISRPVVSPTAPVSSSTTTTARVAPQQPPPSKPANGHAASLTLPIPKAGEVTLNNKSVGAKKGKRPPSSSGSKGSLLIRPASNLVPTSANPNAQLPSIKKYNDVKSGVFQPPSANPTYLAGLEDEFDIPVTNIDDVMDDVPVTNLDDLGDMISNSGSPRLEQDADRERKILSSKYDFIGAGVTTSKNLLIKTRAQKLRITFNDQMTSTYEYPSEQSLLEELPPEPGDFDYIHQLHGKKGISDDDNDVVDLNPNAGAALRSTPGLGSGAPDVNDADKKVILKHPRLI